MATFSSYIVRMYHMKVFSKQSCINFKFKKYNMYTYMYFHVVWLIHVHVATLFHHTYHMKVFPKCLKMYFLKITLETHHLAVFLVRSIWLHVRMYMCYMQAIAALTMYRYVYMYIHVHVCIYVYITYAML